MAKQKGRGMVGKREPSWSDLEPWMEEEVVSSSLPTIKESGPGAIVEKEDEVVEDELMENGDDEIPPEIPPELPPDDSIPPELPPDDSIPPELLPDDSIPPELPPDDSLANIEEYPPSIPEEGPPSMMEDDSQQLPQDSDDGRPTDSNLSEEEKPFEQTLDESTHSKGLHKEESFQGEPPLPPEGEPPLLTFDESSEELSWEQAQQENITQQLSTSDSPPHSPSPHIIDSPQSTPLHISGNTPQSTTLPIADITPHQTVQIADEKTVIAQSTPPLKGVVDDTTVTSTSPPTTSESGELSGEARPPSPNSFDLSENSEGLPSANGLTLNKETAEQPSSEHSNRLSEAPSVELDTSLEQDNVFTVTLKKGFRGLGFMLDKQRSLDEGTEKAWNGVWESDFTICHHVFCSVYV